MTTEALTDHQRMRARWLAARSVTCPKCAAHPGDPCQSTGGGNYAQVADHTVRRQRIAHWTEEQRVAFGALVLQQGSRKSWFDMPAGYYAESEAAAAPITAKTAKQPTPKGVRLSEVQAEKIEWAAACGGRTSASTAHFHGDAAERQTVNALAAKGILAEVGLSDDGYDRRYALTSFGWRVYREHRLIIRRLSAEEIDAGVAVAVARETKTKEAE